jgi:RNase P protein component
MLYQLSYSRVACQSSLAFTLLSTRFVDPKAGFRTLARLCRFWRQPIPSRSNRNETDVPSQPTQACKQARLQVSHGNQERAETACQTPCERQNGPDRQRYPEREVIHAGGRPRPGPCRPENQVVARVKTESESKSHRVPEARLRFPRRYRLKKRHLIRPFFDRGSRGSVTAGQIRLLFRVVPSSQLPLGVRVQAGVVAPRGVRGVRRNRIRRGLSEAFRQFGLPRLIRSMDGLLRPADALTLLVVDRRRTGAALDFAELGGQMIDAVREMEMALRLSPGPVIRN